MELIPSSSLQVAEAVKNSALKYVPSHSLLSSTGADWDYCARGLHREEGLVEELTPVIHKLVENNNNSEKQKKPILLALAAPGQGKSRFLQELPGLVEATGEVKKVYPFLLTFENGEKFEADHETSPAASIASRMLWQLLQPVKKSGWVEANLQPGFTFIELRQAVGKAVGDENLNIDDVLRAVCRGENLPWSKETCILLALDGIQAFPGFDKPTNKETFFYKSICSVCAVVSRGDGPMVIGALSATVQVGMTFALADSPQARHYVSLPLLDEVCRSGKKVFDFEDDVFKLLYDDMGGHGRALEALEEATKECSRENLDLLLAKVCSKLIEKYPSAVPENFEGILKAALSGRWLGVREQIDGYDLEHLHLVKLEYNADRTQRRIRLPYIWIYLGVTRAGTSPELAKWSLYGYKDIRTGGGTGLDFEEFCWRFRALRSSVWEDGETVTIGDLHRGALLCKGLGEIQIVNSRLALAKSRQRFATNGKRFLMQKGQKEKKLASTNEVVPVTDEAGNKLDVDPAYDIEATAHYLF